MQLFIRGEVRNKILNRLARLIHKFFKGYERINNSLSSEPGFKD